MSHVLCKVVGRAAGCTALAAVFCLGVATAYAQHDAAAGASPGRIDFDAAKLPAATVEVNLSRGMFGDLVGLGEAAIAGAAETLQQSENAGRGSEGTRIAAEQLAASKQILQLAQDVVHEVRVRVYENLSEGKLDAEKLMTDFDGPMSASNWENIVRVRDGDDTVRVSLLRKDGAVLGAFVIASDGGDLVLVNVVGDVSPENVKKLTAAAAKIGLENGLQQALDRHMQHLRHRLPPPEATSTDADRPVR